MTILWHRHKNKKGNEDNNQLSQLVIQLSLNPGGPQNITNAQTGQLQAESVLRLDALLNLLNKGRPSSSDPKREIYDSAVRNLGQGNVDVAMGIVNRSIKDSLNHLVDLMKQPSASVGENQSDMVSLLQRMDAGISKGEDPYAAFDSMGNTIASLLRTLRGGEAQAAPTQRDQTAAKRELPMIQTQLRDLGPVHLLSNSSNQTVVALNAQPSTSLIGLFGNQTNAQNAENALANAYAVLANNPNNLSAQQAAAHQLHDALAKIPTNSAIWSSTGHPQFTAAMNALAAGNLQQGLTSLSQETAFNTVFGSLNNIYVVSVNQRSVAILRGGVTVRYEFDKNQEAFTEFMRTAQSGEFQPRLLWMAMGLYYEKLLVSGELDRYAVQQGNAGSPGGLKKVSSQQLTGTGDVVSVTPQIALGASAWGNPMEIVFHCNVGYQSYQLGTTIPNQGTVPQNISVGDKGAYIGIWGAEVRFPGREGERSMIRVSRADIGAIGSPENFFASVSFEGNWYEGNTLRIKSEVSPQYSYFLQEHRVGAEVRPADFTIQVNPNWTFFFGPGFRYDFDATTGANYLEGYGTLGFRFDRGVSIDLRGGYLGETGGIAGERVPSTPFGALNIVITPEDIFKKRKAVPKKEGGN